MTLVPCRRTVLFSVATLAAVALLAVLAFVSVGYRVWTPGLDVTDGRHDRERNAIWLQHAWLGADGWFRREHKQDHLAIPHDVPGHQRAQRRVHGGGRRLTGATRRRQGRGFGPVTGRVHG